MLQEFSLLLDIQFSRLTPTADPLNSSITLPSPSPDPLAWPSFSHFLDPLCELIYFKNPGYACICTITSSWLPERYIQQS